MSEIPKLTGFAYKGWFRDIDHFHQDHSDTEITQIILADDFAGAATELENMPIKHFPYNIPYNYALHRVRELGPVYE